MKVKLLIILIVVSVFQFITSCKKEHYDYMSENNKLFIFYNLNDTLKFYNETDTIIGTVTKKEFILKEKRYSLTPGIHYEEEGTLIITNIDTTKEIIVSISSLNQLGTITIYYSFYNEAFGFYGDSSVCNFAYFSKRLIDEKEIPKQEILIDDKTYMDIFYKLTINKNGMEKINFNNKMIYYINK